MFKLNRHIVYRLYASYKSAYKIIVEVARMSSIVNFEAYRRVYFDPRKSYIFSGEIFSKRSVITICNSVLT